MRYSYVFIPPKEAYALDAAKAMSALRRADELHLRKTAMTALHPAAHFAVAFLFIVAVLSRGGHSLSGFVPFVLYPAAVMFLGDIPPGLIAARVAPALPFVALVGASNLIFAADKSAAWLSFFAICVKCVLCAAAALLLVCVCGIGGIARALDFFRVPKLLVAQLSFTYRYLHVLGEEVVGVINAYSLRSYGRNVCARGMSIRQFGPICGGLFLRSLKRAEAIHAAMLCRGFTGSMPVAKLKSFSQPDAIWTLCWLAFFTVCTIWDLPLLLGNLILGAV